MDKNLNISKFQLTLTKKENLINCLKVLTLYQLKKVEFLNFMERNHFNLNIEKMIACKNHIIEAEKVKSQEIVQEIKMTLYLKKKNQSRRIYI